MHSHKTNKKPMQDSLFFWIWLLNDNGKLYIFFLECSMNRLDLIVLVDIPFEKHGET